MVDVSSILTLSQIKNMIMKSLKGPGTPTEPSDPQTSTPSVPAPPLSPTSSVKDDVEEMINEEILNEMLVRELKRISAVVVKEDFYEFINKGNNIIRTLEENGIERPKKYLEYLVRNNIM